MSELIRRQDTIDVVARSYAYESDRMTALQELPVIKELECLDAVEMAKIAIAMEKLKEYQQLEEQGLLLKLPCKVGDTVHIIIGKNISKQKIVWIELRDKEMLFITRRRKFSNCDIGECVFLTKEEAEKALEEMQCK